MRILLSFLLSLFIISLSAQDSSLVVDTIAEVVEEEHPSSQITQDSTTQYLLSFKERMLPKIGTPETTATVKAAEVEPIEEEVDSSIGEVIQEEITHPPSIGDYLSFGKIFWSIIICILGYFLILILTKIIDNLAERSTNYRITLKSISPFIRILGWMAVIFIIVVDIFRPPYQTVVAVLASAGIAVGFASQDILKNVFGGFMILLDRPFKVGDKILVGEYYGEVVEIGIRSTRIVTKDDSLVSLPNSEVVNQAVSNSNAGEPNCQVVAEIYLPIDVDTDRVRIVAIEAAQVSRFIYLNKPIAVLFINEIKERRSYLKMRLKAYVSDIRNEFAFQSDMTEIVMKELLAQGIVKKENLQ